MAAIRCSRMLTALVTLLVGSLGPLRADAGNGTPTFNPVQRENKAPGSADWEITNPALDHEIEGYASHSSVGHDETIRFFVNVRAIPGEPPPDYTIQIFRVGWYHGVGARAVTGAIRRRGIVQPPPLFDAQTKLVECDWQESFEKNIPNGWVSGVYLAKLTELAEHKSAYILFVVRDDGRSADYLLQLPVTTYQAYNSWGGHALYTSISVNGERAVEVSFDRPYEQRKGGDGSASTPHRGAGVPHFFWWDVNLLRYLEKEGYDVSYATSLDTHERPQTLLAHRAFLSSGHDEYWSLDMRENVEAALTAGVGLAFFGANAAYGRVRLEPSRSTGVPNRTMVGYRSTACTEDPLALDLDASNDPIITGLFRASCTPSQPALPEAALVGVAYYYCFGGDVALRVANTWHWAFSGTGLQDGDELYGLVGYEVDKVGAASPTSLVVLASSPIPSPGDCDSATSPQDPTNMTIYQAGSGALVFATGTLNWAWGLDAYDPDGPTGVCCAAATPKATRLTGGDAVRRITRNVLEALIQ